MMDTAGQEVVLAYFDVSLYVCMYRGFELDVIVLVLMTVVIKYNSTCNVRFIDDDDIVVFQSSVDDN